MLTEEQVIAIRKARDAGKLYKVIAHEFGISHNMAQRICCGTAYKKFGGPIALAYGEGAKKYVERLLKTDTDDCITDWPYKTKDGNGYPIISYPYKRGTYLVSRFICEIKYGTKPDGMYAVHTCGNPKCVNPKHIKWGYISDTRRETARIKMPQDILALYNNGARLCELAEYFHISFRAVQSITTKARVTHAPIPKMTKARNVMLGNIMRRREKKQKERMLKKSETPILQKIRGSYTFSQYHDMPANILALHLMMREPTVRKAARHVGEEHLVKLVKQAQA